jgi:hypothetical protein
MNAATHTHSIQHDGQGWTATGFDDCGVMVWRFGPFQTWDAALAAADEMSRAACADDDSE